jgi:ABC-2 type transport system permease protein
MLLIARREYLEQVRGRAFRLSTIGLPLLFALFIGISFKSNQGIATGEHLVIASSNTTLANEVRDRLVKRKGGAEVEVVPPLTEEARAGLIARIQARTLDGILTIEAGDGQAPTATYISKSSGGFVTNSRLNNALNDGIVAGHLKAGGMGAAQADAVVKGAAIETFQVKQDGSVVKSNAMGSFWKGYVMAFLLTLTTLIYGMNVARSIIQEKTSRIFEVMLAAATPNDLLAGKLIGVGAVGLTQIVIWLAAGAAILAAPFAGAMVSGEFSIHFSWAEGVLFPVYFLLGYLLYSSMFAGLASTCETEQELQMFMPLAALPTWLSFALIVPVMNDSNSMLSLLASFFPPTAPIIMFLRMASEMPPAWQFVVSIGLLLASIWGMLWVSSRLYRIGILMYGKRATLPEILRWLRYS